VDRRRKLLFLVPPLSLTVISPSCLDSLDCPSNTRAEEIEGQRRKGTRWVGRAALEALTGKVAITATIKF
jgi:hypothetical protein